MTRFVRALVLGSALGVAAGGCAPADPCDGHMGTCIAVDFRGDVGTIDSLHLAVTGAANDETTLSLPAGVTTLPIALAVLLGPNASGTINGAAAAIAAGKPVAAGHAQTTIVMGGRTRLVINLERGTTACADGVHDGDETDVDCGGSCGGNCALGKRCGVNGDCASVFCHGGICAATSCSDGVKNGTESDIDCGGTCSPCAEGFMCGGGKDCKSLSCQGGLCAIDNCVDGIKNGKETDIDCGDFADTGCDPCKAGGKCLAPEDCEMAVCTMGVCQAGSCGDGVTNGKETDVDCGGGDCPKCANGKMCMIPDDCLVGACAGGLCALAGIDFVAARMLPVAAAGDPHAVATGDFDGDGKVDLAVGVASTHSVDVYLNTGIGMNGKVTFGAPTPLMGGVQPTAILVGQFNGDKNLDLAVIDYTGSALYLSMGKGGGAFQAPIALVTGAQPVALGIGDFHNYNDGRIDFVVANAGGHSLSMFVPGANGTWGKIDKGLLGQPNGLTVGDFDKDGKLDVVCSMPPGIDFLQGSGQGSFTEVMTNEMQNGYQRVISGDWNNDGWRDLAIADSVRGGIAIILKSSMNNLAWGTEMFVGGNPGEVALVAGDWNKDFIVDLAAVATTSHSVSIWSGTGGSLTPFVSVGDFAVGKNPISIATADLDGDTLLDIVSADMGDGTVAIVTGIGKFDFNAAMMHQCGPTPSGLVLNDFNADKVLDVAVTSVGRNDVEIYFGTGNGLFKTGPAAATGMGPLGLVAGDFHQLGRLDILTANGPSNSLSLISNTGNGMFSAAANFAVAGSPGGLAVGDLDGKNGVDTVAASFSSNAVSVLLNNGSGAFGAVASYPTGAGPIAVQLGDLDGDSLLDVVTANSGEKSISVLLGAGVGLLKAATKVTVGANPGALRMADLDGDGHLDVVVTNAGDNTVSVLLGNGHGAFAAPTTITFSGPPRDLVIGDFNADKALDIAAVVPTQSMVFVARGKGDGSFVLPVGFAAGQGANSLVIGFVDGDAYPDIITANNTGASFTVLRGLPGQ